MTQEDLAYLVSDGWELTDGNYRKRIAFTFLGHDYEGYVEVAADEVDASADPLMLLNEATNAHITQAHEEVAALPPVEGQE